MQNVPEGNECVKGKGRDEGKVKSSFPFSSSFSAALETAHGDLAAHC